MDPGFFSKYDAVFAAIVMLVLHAECSCAFPHLVCVKLFFSDRPQNSDNGHTYLMCKHIKKENAFDSVLQLCRFAQPR